MVEDQQDQQTTTTTATAKQNPKRQSTHCRISGSATKRPEHTVKQADRRTEPEGEVLDHQPVCPVCFVCSSSSGGGARWSPHYQVARSTGAARRRAPRVHTCVSFARRAGPIAPRATCGLRRCAGVRLFVLRVRDHVARSRSPPFASLNSIAVISSQVPCLDKRLRLFHFFARRNFALRTSCGVRGGQAGATSNEPGRRTTTMVPARSIRAHETQSDVVAMPKKPRYGVVVGSGHRRLSRFRRFELP